MCHRNKHFKFERENSDHDMKLPQKFAIHIYNNKHDYARFYRPGHVFMSRDCASPKINNRTALPCVSLPSLPAPRFPAFTDFLGLSGAQWSCGWFTHHFLATLGNFYTVTLNSIHSEISLLSFLNLISELLKESIAEKSQTCKLWMVGRGDSPVTLLLQSDKPSLKHPDWGACEKRLGKWKQKMQLHFIARNLENIFLTKLAIQKCCLRLPFNSSFSQVWSLMEVAAFTSNTKMVS